MMFSDQVWGILIATFILISIMQYLVPPRNLPERHTRRSLSWVVMNLLGAFLLLPSDLRRDRLSDVILSTTLSMFTITVAYVYVGQIHSILAIPVYEPPIDTIVDLAVSGITWNAPHEAWMYALVGTENVYSVILFPLFNTYWFPLFLNSQTFRKCLQPSRCPGSRISRELRTKATKPSSWHCSTTATRWSEPGSMGKTLKTIVS